MAAEQAGGILFMRDGEGNTYALPSSELAKYKVPAEMPTKLTEDEDVSGHWWGPGGGYGWGHDWWNNWNFWGYGWDQWSQPAPQWVWNGFEWVLQP